MKSLLSTDLTDANISSVVRLLTTTPMQLQHVRARLEPTALHQPLKIGERSFAGIVAHIVHCDERTTESIYAALLLREPTILDIHPERQWGQLLHYEAADCDELLLYFSFRRKTLLRILGGLTLTQWARALREHGKQRAESVYWRARTMTLHEQEHLNEIESRLLG
jgi:hypothetical protein